MSNLIDIGILVIHFCAGQCLAPLSQHIILMRRFFFASPVRRPAYESACRLIRMIVGRNTSSAATQPATAT
jgi:hypothetical protein